MVLGGGKECKGWGSLKKGHSWMGIKEGKELQRQTRWKSARMGLVHLGRGGWQWQTSKEIPRFVSSPTATWGSPRIIPYERNTYQKRLLHPHSWGQHHTPYSLSQEELGRCIIKAKALCKLFPPGTQEQGKPLSPITEKVARPDPSSTSAGRVRENSSETVLSEEGRTQKFIPWKKYHRQV